MAIGPYRLLARDGGKDQRTFKVTSSDGTKDGDLTPLQGLVDATQTAINPARKEDIETLAGAAGNTPPSLPTNATGIIGWLRLVVDGVAALATALAGSLKITRPPLTFSNVAGSPFTLTAAWAKVATTTANTKGLTIAPVYDATAYDIEWAVVTAGASAPVDTYGVPIQGGEDFAAGLPIGDIYLKSATGQKAVVRTGA